MDTKETVREEEAVEAKVSRAHPVSLLART
jgi:hypothetical protein